MNMENYRYFVQGNLGFVDNTYAQENNDSEKNLATIVQFWWGHS